MNVFIGLLLALCIFASLLAVLWMARLIVDFAASQTVPDGLWNTTAMGLGLVSLLWGLFYALH
jgi:hypothetical protein